MSLLRVHLSIAAAVACAVALRVVDERLGSDAAIAVGVLGAVTGFATLGLLTAYRRARRAITRRARPPKTPRRDLIAERTAVTRAVARTSDLEIRLMCAARESEFLGVAGAAAEGDDLEEADQR